MSLTVQIQDPLHFKLVEKRKGHLFGDVLFALMKG
jgi:hypothetical protein